MMLAYFCSTCISLYKGEYLFIIVYIDRAVNPSNIPHCDSLEGFLSYTYVILAVFPRKYKALHQEFPRYGIVSGA